jgi:hypothetical protein
MADGRELRRRVTVVAVLTAISRHRARVPPITEELVAGRRARGEFIQGRRDRIERVARVVRSVLEHV